MMTFFHSPKSRSSRVAALVTAMGLQDQIETRLVTIPRMDGTGQRDPANPHPEGKVPCLIHDGRLITETGAIMVYLTSLFPDRGMAPVVGDPLWGEYLAWMVWYHAAMEPVLTMQAGGFSHPWLTAAMRGPDEVVARLRAALEKGPWLLGQTYSAADILVHSPYGYFPEATPDDPLIRDWVLRCIARSDQLSATGKAA